MMGFPTGWRDVEPCHWIAGTLFFLMTFALLKLAGMAIRNTL